MSRFCISLHIKVLLKAVTFKVLVLIVRICLLPFAGNANDNNLSMELEGYTLLMMLFFNSSSSGEGTRGSKKHKSSCICDLSDTT